MQDNDDLSEIALNVRRRRANDEAGRRLANHPLTHLYLQAGVRLLEKEFFAADSGEGWHHPLSTLTRDNIVTQAGRLADAGVITPREGSFRDRWPALPGYFADLVRYVLRDRYWSDELRLAMDSARRFGAQDRFSDLVHEIAYRDTDLVFTGSAALRFHLLATALADRYDTVLEALTGVYGAVTAQWERTYQSVLADHGLRLRPNISANELTILFTALAEGLSKRDMGDRTVHLVDHSRRRSLLGKGALLFLAGAVDRGDGRTVEQAMDDLAESPKEP